MGKVSRQILSGPYEQSLRLVPSGPGPLDVKTSIESANNSCVLKFLLALL